MLNQGCPDRQKRDFEGITGFGGLHRVVDSTIKIFVCTNSQFFAKVLAHENKHKDDFASGFGDRRFWSVTDFWLIIWNETAGSEGDLRNKIDYDREVFNFMQKRDYNSADCVRDFEIRAYAVSDLISPLYFYLYGTSGLE